MPRRLNRRGSVRAKELKGPNTGVGLQRGPSGPQGEVLLREGRRLSVRGSDVVTIMS